MPTKSRPIRALVVDDIPDAAESLARLLQHMGCAATFITDSAKTMDAAEAMAAEIVFLDIGMPGMDGYQVAKMIRSRYGDAVVLVAVTAYGSFADRVRSRQAGIDAHVPHGFTSMNALLAFWVWFFLASSMPHSSAESPHLRSDRAKRRARASPRS